MKGLFYHNSLVENFYNINLDELSKIIKVNLDKIIKNSKEKYAFVLIIFGDLKDYKFHF